MIRYLERRLPDGYMYVVLLGDRALAVTVVVGEDGVCGLDVEEAEAPGEAPSGAKAFEGSLCELIARKTLGELGCARILAASGDAEKLCPGLARRSGRGG